MNLSPDCFEKVGTVIHEFLHCLGFIHQHSAPERDDYVTILWDNVDKGCTKSIYIQNVFLDNANNVPLCCSILQ